MSGTRIGGLKAAATNKAKNKNYYAIIGSKSKSTTGGFASRKIGFDGLTGPERARLAGGQNRKKKDAVPETEGGDQSPQDPEE